MTESRREHSLNIQIEIACKGDKSHTERLSE